LERLRMSTETLQNLKMEFVDNSADGLRLVTQDNWSGECLICSRTALPKRSEVSSKLLDVPGVYLLVGPPKARTDGSPIREAQLYVGQADSVADRLETHLKSEEKKWWNTAVVIRRIEKNPLNLTNCKFLESSLCSLAIACTRCDFNNKVAPQLPSAMSKGEQSSMDDFLQKTLITLTALGWDFFPQPSVVSTDSIPSVSPAHVPPSGPPDVPQNLKPLLDELRGAVTGSSFPKSEWYWTRTPDYRAKVVNDGDFRVFFRIVWSKNWFWLKLKDVGRYKIAKSSDIDNIRKEIETAYKKAEQYLKRGK
jgi:hypothetical protein